MQAGPANCAVYDNRPVLVRHPQEWARRREEILGDFYARSKNLSLISTQADYDGLELAELGYKPVEYEDNETHDHRCCSVCNNLPNLTHGHMCTCTGNAMRNLLQNAIHSRRRDDFCLGMVPYQSRSSAGVRETGVVRRSAERQGRFGNGINVDYRNVQFGMKKNAFKETYATVEIRQNTWSYRKRDGEYGESSNTERRSICARRPSLKSTYTRRGFGRGDSETTGEDLGTKADRSVIGINKLRTKKTRFKEDVEIMEDKILDGDNDTSKCKSKDKHARNALENDPESLLCHNSNEDSENEAIAQRELDEKLKDLYKYVLSFEKEDRFGNPSAIQDNRKTRNVKQNAALRPAERKSSGVKRHLNKGIYRKVEVVLKRPRMKLDEDCLREYMEMKKRMDELMNKIMKERNEKPEYARTQNEDVCEVHDTDKEISSNTHPKRSHLEIHLQSFYSKEDGNTNDMSNKNPPKITDFSHVDENLSPKVNTKSTVSDDTSHERDYTNAQDEGDSLYSSISDSIEKKSTRDRRFSSIQHSPKPNSRKNIRLAQDDLGYSKSASSYRTPSKAVMRRQVKCILRRSPPGTSLRRMDPRRSQPAQKVRSRSELISRSEHTGHYYASQDSMFPSIRTPNRKRGTSLPSSASMSQSGVFRSLQSRSFSSSVKISRLERGMSYQTLGNSDLEDILSSKEEKSSNVEDISFHGHTERIFNSSMYSRKDDILWNMSNVKSNDVSSKKNKSLVLETFKDVLEYIQHRKPPDTILSAQVIHNTSPYPVKNRGGNINSTGCQVLESFFDLIKYLREIKAASQLHCSGYHATEHGITPNPQGDAKEFSRTPFKFTSKKHGRFCDRGFLVLEAFREVLKLMKEEEYVEISEVQCKPTESVFPSKNDKNFLFFELHNAKLFSDSKKRVENSPHYIYEPSAKLDNENSVSIKPDVVVQSVKPKTTRKKVPAMKQPMRKLNKAYAKERPLRQFFSLPVFGNVKRVTKERKLKGNKREMVARKTRELKKKEKYKSVQDHRGSKKENNKSKSKHHIIANDVVVKEKTENKHYKRTKSKTKVAIAEERKESKVELRNKIKESKEKSKVEENDMDNTPKDSLPYKPKWRGAADGEACGPSNAKILTRLDEKSKPDVPQEFANNSKSLHSLDKHCKTSRECDKLNGPHTKSLTRIDEKSKSKATYSVPEDSSYAKILSWLHENCKLGTATKESYDPNITQKLTTLDEKYKLDSASGKYSDRSNAKTLNNNEKDNMNIVDSKARSESKHKNVAMFDENRKVVCTSGKYLETSGNEDNCIDIVADEHYRRSKTKSNTRFNGKPKSDSESGKLCEPEYIKKLTSIPEKCKSGEFSGTSNAQHLSKFDEKCKSGEFSGTSNAQRLSKFDEKSKSNIAFAKPYSPNTLKLITSLAEIYKSGGKCCESFELNNSPSIASFNKKYMKGTECVESSGPSSTRILTKFDEKHRSGTSQGELMNTKDLTNREEKVKSSVFRESCDPSKASIRRYQHLKCGVLDGKTSCSYNAKSLTRFDEKLKSEPSAGESYGRSNAKSLTSFDEKNKICAKGDESCVSRITYADRCKSKFDIPTVFDRNDIRISTNNPQSQVSSKTVLNGSPNIYPSASTNSFNKELQMVKTSQNNLLHKDSPPRKLQRNAKALEKMASERYCHLRRRPDVQEEQNDKN